MNDQELEKQVVELVERISPLLAGKEPPVQSAVIADLLARWVLGFYVPGDRKATKELQAKFLARHLGLVKDLIKMQGEEVYKDILERN